MDIFEAVRCNNEKDLKHIVEYGGISLANTTTTDKQTVAHVAADTGNLPILKYLLNKDDSLLSVQDACGRTVLHLAARKGSLPMVKYLIDVQKADFIQPVKHQYGNTVLHIAAQKGHISLVKYFIEEKKFSVNLKNNVGEPPLFLAAENAHLNIIKYLVDEQKADTLALDGNLDHVLYVSAKHNDVSVPRFLVDEKKVDYVSTWRDYIGDTILHRAAWFDSVDFIRYFVEEKKIDVNCMDTFNRTPVYQAVFRSHMNTIQFLAEHGANLEIADNIGRRPVDICIDDEISSYLKKMMSKRDRRSILKRVVPHRRHQELGAFSYHAMENIDFVKKSQLEDQESPRGKSVSSSGYPSFWVGNFLLLADICIRRIYGFIDYNHNHNNITLSVKELVERRMDNKVVEMVNSESSYEKNSSR